MLELAMHSKEAGLGVAIGVFENSQNPNLELADAARASGLGVKIFPCNGRFDKNTIEMISDYVEKAGVQILHSHNFKSNFYARMALLNKNVPWVVTKHGRRLGPKLFLYNVLDGFIVRNADRIVAVSKRIAQQLKLAGINETKILVIENGVNLGRFNGNDSANRTRESLRIKKGVDVIGSIGSLTKEKGHAYLLKAAPKIIEKFPGAIFLIVGDGREREKLEKMVAKFGIRDKVIFTGMRKDIPEILSILDVFVFPSLKEGLPLALLEAQASRVPVVAARVGAIPDVVKDGATGVLVPPKATEAIAEAVNRVLSDRTSALKMAQRGFERVQDKFSSARMANEYLSLYRELF